MMSAIAWISEFSECELSGRSWTATHEFGRQTVSFRTTPVGSCVGTFWRTLAKDQKWPHCCCYQMEWDGVRTWVWGCLDWNEAGAGIRSRCFHWQLWIHFIQVDAQQAGMDMTSWPWKSTPAVPVSWWLINHPPTLEGSPISWRTRVFWPQAHFICQSFGYELISSVEAVHSCAVLFAQTQSGLRALNLLWDKSQCAHHFCFPTVRLSL